CGFPSVTSGFRHSSPEHQPDPARSRHESARRTSHLRSSDRESHSSAQRRLSLTSLEPYTATYWSVRIANACPSRSGVHSRTPEESPCSNPSPYAILIPYGDGLWETARP